MLIGTADTASVCTQIKIIKYFSPIIVEKQEREMQPVRLFSQSIYQKLSGSGKEDNHMFALTMMCICSTIQSLV